MYTNDEKARAVELCIEFGKKAAAAIRELGYPGRAQLRAWDKEWEEDGGSLPEHSMERYGIEQKRTAVEHYWICAKLLTVPDPPDGARTGARTGMRRGPRLRGGPRSRKIRGRNVSGGQNLS